MGRLPNGLYARVEALDSVEEAPVADVSTIGLDLAKHVFQAHGADAPGPVVLRKRLRRERVLGFSAGKPAYVVAMEACGGAHHWGGALAELGHTQDGKGTRSGLPTASTWHGCRSR
jgi:hypothetical protein